MYTNLQEFMGMKRIEMKWYGMELLHIHPCRPQAILELRGSDVVL